MDAKFDFCMKAIEQQIGTSYQAPVSSDEEPEYAGDDGEDEPVVEWRGDGDDTSDEDEDEEE